MATETVATEAAGHVAEAAGHAAEGPGMPQLDFSTFPNQIFWLAVALVVLYFVVSRMALPRIAATLADRQGTISTDLTEAEDMKLKAIDAEKSYDAALVAARAEAQRIVAAAREAIQGDLNKAIADADAGIAAKAAESERRIGEIRASALDSVSVVARDTAAELVAALGGKADAKAVADAVAQRMKG